MFFNTNKTHTQIYIYIRVKFSQSVVDWCRHGRDSMVVGFTTLPMKSVHITIDVVSSNLDQGDVHNMLSDLRQVGGFLQFLRSPPPIQLTAKK